MVLRKYFLTLCVYSHKNEKKESKVPNLLILLACLILGVFSRWLPHPPNFTPVIAIAIFIGMRFQQKWLVVLTPLAIMFISDIFLGFHNTAIVTYASLILLSLAVMSAPKNGIFKSKSIQIASFSLVGSIWFFFYPMLLCGGLQICIHII